MFQFSGQVLLFLENEFAHFNTAKIIYKCGGERL